MTFYTGTLSAKLQNISPPQDLKEDAATICENFYSPKKGGILKRKKGLNLKSFLAHRLAISEASSDTHDLFAIFTANDKPFQNTPVILTMTDIFVDGFSVVLVGGNLIEPVGEVIVGTVDFFTGIVSLSPAATLSATVTIKLLDPILGIGELSKDNGFSTYITDGLSIFEYENSLSLSVAVLPYAAPPSNLEKLWFFEEVFIDGSGGDRTGTAILSDGDLTDIPMFSYKAGGTTASLFEPVLVEGTPDIKMTSAKRIEFLRGRTFAMGIKTDEEGGNILETRVQWSALRDALLPDSWKPEKLFGAGFFELDDIIEDSKKVNDAISIFTYKSIWEATPSYVSGTTVAFKKSIDSFPSILGFTSLQSHGSLYTANTRGIFGIEEGSLLNISEGNGVRIDDVFRISRNSPNNFSIADQKEGMLYFHAQQAENLFSDKSVAFSVDNGTWSFFTEFLTTGKNVSTEDSYIFADYEFIGDMNFRVSQSRRFDERQILFGDTQGNLYKRDGISGKANPILFTPTERPSYLDGNFFVKGEGFNTEEVNAVWQYDSSDPDGYVLRNEEGGTFDLSTLSNLDYEGRFVILEDFKYETAQYNAFPKKRRVFLREVRMFISTLEATTEGTEPETSGIFSLQAFQRTRNLLKREIDLYKRSPSFLYDRWVKMLMKCSGQSIGLRLFLEDSSFFSGRSAFDFEVESSQVFLEL